MHYVHHSKKSQRGAALTGYALVLSAFTVLSLGAVEGLNSASTTYLSETSEDISESRELALYDELEEIPEPNGDGGDTDENTDDQANYELADGGQFQSPADGLCMTLEGDDNFRQRACDGSAEQQISVYTNAETGSSQLRIGGQCIGLENNSDQNGDPYMVQDCDGDNPNQLFRRNDVDQTWESQSNRDPLMCIDVQGSGGGDGSIVQQYGCHGGTNQEWPEPAPYVPPFAGPPTPTATGDATVSDSIPSGADFSPDGAFESDDTVFVFTESSILLTSDTTIDGTVVPAGTIVCSYIVWYDPVTDNGAAATIDFGAPVIGGARSPAELAATDSFASPGVIYDYTREWESSDSFNVSGNTVGVTPSAVVGNADMLRVFTQCG